MLTPLKPLPRKIEEPTVRAADARLPRPFAEGLEYSPPARGPWTIVHVGMLVPESHEIFVCAQACLRGVVLSAAEMHLQNRFSTITVTEEHFREGMLEETIIEGTTEILKALPKIPPAVLLFSSCVHHFTGADVDWALKVLSERFPGVVFTDAYMTPTFRKSEMPPDDKMRMQLYHGLPRLKNPKGGLLLAGTLEAFGAKSDFARAAARAGIPFYEIAATHTYDAYKEMANARTAVVLNPAAREAGRLLAERGLNVLDLPLSYDEAEIDACLSRLEDALGLEHEDRTEEHAAARAALLRASAAVNEAGLTVAICRSATTRPAGLALRLIEAGIPVTDLYADAILPGDRPAFERLRETASDLRVHPTTTPEMRFTAPNDWSNKNVLAIGQKAAWFTGARHFVNLIEGGDLWGHRGLAELADRISAAARTETDAARIIRVKGYGCMGCTE